MKVAVLFRGGMSKKIGRLMMPEDINIESDYINYKCAYNSFKKHIIDANPSHSFDIFIHTWHPDLENDLKDLYKPIEIKTENNLKYKSRILYSLVNSNSHISCFSIVSQALSQKLVCKMVEKHCTKNNFEYDIIILYRLDLLLIKDMILENYDLNSITCNNWAHCWGDFHFVMNYKNMLKFAKIYDEFCPSLQPIVHQYTKMYVNKYLNIPYKQDDISAGIDQEVVRKAINLIEKANINYDKLLSYNISEEEILSYNVDNRG